MPELQLFVASTPKRFYCAVRDSVPAKYVLPESVRFPCYIEDFGTYWQVRVKGEVVYLHTIDSLTLYKDIYAALKAYGLGLKSLGNIDSLPLSYLDGLRLGYITTSTAEWLGLSCGTAGFVPFVTLGDYDSAALAGLDKLKL